MVPACQEVIERKTRFVIVTGGVLSSIGKGVLTASIGVLLKNVHGNKIAVVKWDPYLNVDPGTMSPLEHGEVFVTDDGAETDLDLGHYERILNTHFTRDSSVTSGKIFQEILTGEREGRYLGRCIQLVPHVVDAICNRLLQYALSSNADVVLVEIGGTVGDIEGEVFLEAVRQLRMHLAPHQLFHAHLSYVPYLEWANELKTKPTQHSVMLLKKAGLMPDCLFLRCEQPATEDIFQKMARMTGVAQELIFQVLTRKPIYKLFLDLQQQGLDMKLQQWFGLPHPQASHLQDWAELIERIESKKPVVRIGLVAKYVGTNEPYISVIEAIKSAAYATGRDPEICTISAHALSLDHDDPAYCAALAALRSMDGIVVPGGFGDRGIEGKIAAARYAREHNVPYLGLCLGMQVMVMESARHCAGLKAATSTEFNQATEHPVIALLEEQRTILHKGGSMRLGVFACKVTPGTKAYAAYESNLVYERHRHRYEVNNAYRAQLEAAGLVFSGKNEELDLVEIAERKEHPFMLGTQFHPEFLSTPLMPHPLFRAFMEAIIAQK